MLKRYTSQYPQLSMTALKEGMIVNIKFENGVFETEDPALQAAIEGNLHFGAQIWEATGDPEPKELNRFQRSGEARRGKPQVLTDHDPLAAVVFEEKENAQKARSKAKKASKKERS